MTDYEEYGRVVCAALLHHNCIYMAKKGHHVIFPMEPKGVLKLAPQGFVTENGYFVDRKLALEIATYYHQIHKKHHPLDQLVSEDLKKENQKVLQYKKEFTYRRKEEDFLEEKP
ncbi:MAG: hypothetical protein J6X28_00455 [Bacilli bacterium]|nr:hypothetical protein [Bacilli bacterium]